MVSGYYSGVTRRYPLPCREFYLSDDGSVFRCEDCERRGYDSECRTCAGLHGAHASAELLDELTEAELEANSLLAATPAFVFERYSFETEAEARYYCGEG